MGHNKNYESTEKRLEKLDEKTKKNIQSQIEEYKESILMDLLFETDDPNVLDLKKQIEIALKLVHGEYIENLIQKELERLISKEENEKERIDSFKDAIDKIYRLQHEQNDWQYKHDDINNHDRIKEIVEKIAEEKNQSKENKKSFPYLDYLMKRWY